MPRAPLKASAANQISVSRMAGPSFRSTNSLSRLRRIGLAYQVAVARPRSTARFPSRPVKLSSRRRTGPVIGGLWLQMRLRRCVPPGSCAVLRVTGQEIKTVAKFGDDKLPVVPNQHRHRTRQAIENNFPCAGGRLDTKKPAAVRHPGV